ncbi:Probable phosphatase YcdX [Pantoea agglomerans]|uniref:Probable phosphatase YcdX n=1 Tax=Enterobacter agglomerans TaxID=549 RepID=A0A379AHE8_ENTAG|nr:Probable phosphatase YcdX [Pantoea agglomerans]
MYPVDLHMHTIASTHAYSTLHDYVTQAKQTGMKLFAITDHGPTWPTRRTTGTSLICASGRA